MGAKLYHRFVSAVANDPDPLQIQTIRDWNDVHDLYLDVNAQTGTSYALLAADDGSLVTFNNASAVAVTIAQANSGAKTPGTLGFFSGWFVVLRNKGAGVVTITPTTSLIDGAATLTLKKNQSVKIYSDGTDYQVAFLGSKFINDDGTAVTVAAPLAVTDATNATSTSTGAVKITGGVSVVKDIWVGGIVNVAGATTLQSTLTIGGGSIGSDTLEVTGSTTHNGAVVVSGASISLSGNQSAAAWTTSGIRYKNVAATFTDTTSSGTVAAAYTNVFGGSTIAASSAVTFTAYFNTFFKAPIAGTNVTFTNLSALGADSVSIGGAAQSTFALAVTGTVSISGATTIGGAITYGGVTLSNAAVGTGSLVLSVGGSLTALAGLAVRDTSAAFDVTLAATSSTTLTAGRTLTLNMGNVAHTLAFGTTANTITFPNAASDTVAMLAVANSFSAAQAITDATDATSTSTGALKVSGGISAVKALWVGGLTNIAGVLTVQDTTASTSKITGSAIIGGGLGVSGRGNFGGALAVVSTTAAIFNLSGATTGSEYMTMANTGADLYFGIERSTGGFIFNNSTAYSVVLGTFSSASDIFVYSGGVPSIKVRNSDNSILSGPIYAGTAGGSILTTAAISIGGSLSDYGAMGYNLQFQSGGATFKYIVADVSTAIFYDGGFNFKTAPSGTAGNAITFTTAAKIFASGTASTTTTTGTLIVTGGVGISAALNVGGVAKFTDKVWFKDTITTGLTPAVSAGLLSKSLVIYDAAGNGITVYGS